MVCLCVCESMCLLDTRVTVSPAKTAEPIEMPFGVSTLVVLDVVQIPTEKEQFLGDVRPH